MENNIEIVKVTTELTSTTKLLKEIVSELKQVTVNLETRVAKLEEDKKIQEAINKERQESIVKKDRKLARIATILRIMVVVAPVAIGVFSYLSYERGLMQPTPIESHV